MSTQLFSLMALLQIGLLKFIYSEKATKFCEIFPVLLTTVHTVKSKGTISQNFVAFSEYVCIWTLQRRLLITTDPTTNFETTNLIFSPIIDHSEQVLYILSVAVYAINKQSDWPNICENLEFRWKDPLKRRVLCRNITRVCAFLQGCYLSWKDKLFGHFTAIFDSNIPYYPHYWYLPWLLQYSRFTEYNNLRYTVWTSNPDPKARVKLWISYKYWRGLVHWSIFWRKAYLKTMGYLIVGLSSQRSRSDSGKVWTVNEWGR